MAPRDAGSSPVDAGGEAADAGEPAVDAGAPPDAGEAEPHGYACAEVAIRREVLFSREERAEVLRRVYLERQGELERGLSRAPGASGVCSERLVGVASR